ncbi:hypothetical protein AB0K51_25615 [Kitasatospora sp. NPDC049285]|uniref:hypothetical protein n=1 Tax=Kitasatospora sp. NPDC049285 TaxID=3157096 RepID=UPI00343C330C
MVSPAVPLLVLGLIDASFSGFRAYAGRDARIRKRRAVVRSAGRGLGVGAVLLLAPVLTACGILAVAGDSGRAYAVLAAGAVGYLLPIAVYAAVVALSFAGYFLLPFRVSTLAVVMGLGPLTLVRPLVLVAACAGAVLNGGGWAGLAVGVVAAAAVLTVEPVVHRRWYRFALSPGGRGVVR